MQATPEESREDLRAIARNLRDGARRVRASAAYADGQAYRDEIAHAERLEAQARRLEREADESAPR
jgi:hypothetical protein